MTQPLQRSQSFQTSGDSSSVSAPILKSFKPLEAAPDKTTDRVVCINTTDDFKALKKDWNKLVSQSSNPHPFILWEWMFTWWETYSQGTKNKLYILALYRADDLVAVAPFYIQTKGLFIKRLSLIGEGENEEDAAVTSYPDIIVNKNLRDQCVDMISKYINDAIDSSTVFNYASFNLVRENSVLQQVGQKLSSKFIKQQKHSENQFVINLPESEDDYVASLSKSTKKQFRLKQSRLQKAGDLEISTENKLSDGLTIVEKLHRARWAKVSDESAFDSSKFVQFHNALAERFQQQDVMTIRVMRHAGTPIAAAYNFNYQKSCYSYLSGFKSEDDKRYSPMFIFDMLEIKTFISQGFNRYDMLVSESQNNYKTKFGSDVNSVYRIHWLRKGLIAKSMLGFMKVRPLLAKIYHSFSK